MSLSLSLGAANSGLSTSAQQSAVSARNVARVNEIGASRKIANLVTTPGGGVRVSSIVRAADEGLREAVLSARSDVGSQTAISEALTSLSATVGDPQNEHSPSALLGKLSSALQLYASSPQSAASGRAAVTSARDLAAGLNAASDAVTAIMRKADTDTASAVTNVNALLATFKGVNDAIVNGTHSGSDTTDDQDQRDELLKKISDEIGVRAFIRGGNDMVLQTDSGVTLFEHTARSVSFDARPNITQGQTSNAVFIDGVPVTTSQGGMPISSGRIAGLAKIVNDVAPTYGKQLDEMARGLIASFAESDQSPSPILPDVAGLFTYPGAPAIPAAGTAAIGLARVLTVSASVFPEQGGDISRLRDGGIGSSDSKYIYNKTGEAGFSNRLVGLMAKLTTAQSFDPSTALNPQANLGGYAADSAAWLEANRKAATSAADYKSIVLDRSTTSLSNATGINLDQEVTNMLDIERSYQASAKVLGVVNQMLDTLLNTIR
jgi:flagellar hook-associated protein 1